MNHRILIQVTAPAVIIGLVLTGACLLSAWYVNRLQSRMTDILASNVASMQSAQQLEIVARQLRFHCFLYLIDPSPDLLKEIQSDQKNFEEWLAQAKHFANTPQERTEVEAIEEGYDRYRDEFERLRTEAIHFSRKDDFQELADAHPLRQVVDPCRKYQRMNEEMMADASRQNNRVSERLRLTMLFLGLGGPLGGLLSGFGIARGLSRSLHRLSVRIQGMAQQLDREVTDVNLTADGDLGQMDKQLDQVVRRVTEVTERLQQQQRDMLRAQQLAAVGQLAASVAHEVRNPLTSIKMLVEAGLRDRKPRPFTQENLTIVHGEVLRLEQTVQSFLDFARPPALRRSECDLGEVVSQAVDLVRARARQQRVQIDLHIPEWKVRANVDRGQLCTVLVNLFVNALDAMPASGRLGIRLEAFRGHFVSLTVTDTGGGIAPEMVDQLFTPFVSTKPTGSGLGLSISKRIIEEHGGRITAVNGSDGGACFTITLAGTVVEEKHASPAGH